jgi:hypothetical protein
METIVVQETITANCKRCGWKGNYTGLVDHYQQVHGLRPEPETHSSISLGHSHVTVRATTFLVPTVH